MTTATLTPARANTGADDTRIGAAGTLRHIGALTRRNLMRIKADPESMFDAVLMPIVFTLLFAGRAGVRAARSGAWLLGVVAGSVTFTAISVGVARTKFLAKVASAVSKPDGLLVVEPDREEEFLLPLPVERLWGVGAVTAEKLHRYGIRTVGELAELEAAK